MIKLNCLFILVALLSSTSSIVNAKRSSSRKGGSTSPSKKGSNTRSPPKGGGDDISNRQVAICPGDVRECPDGSTVGRVPPDCRFEQCGGGACPVDIAECPDGSTVIREPPDCEFQECENGGCPLDVFECPDGSTVSRLPPDCEFEECTACPLDIFECPDGSTVTRVPPDCEFEACPTEAPTNEPTNAPSHSPTESTESPTTSPTESPTSPPTTAPTIVPSPSPTLVPSSSPTDQETDEPSNAPSSQPTAFPSSAPSSSPTEQGTDEPSSAPSSSPSAIPSTSPSSSPSAMPSSSPSQGPAEVGASAEPSTSPSEFPSATPSFSTAPSMMPSKKALNCSALQYDMEVPGLEGVTLQYVVNLHFDDTVLNTTDWLPNNGTDWNSTDWLPDNITDWVPNDNNTDWWPSNNNTDTNNTVIITGTISVRVVYEGQGWLAFAVSPTGGMLGSDAVIGIPSSSDPDVPGGGNVSKYHLTFDDGANGYVLMGEEHQRTLMDASITQNEDTTILEFTKFLKEEGEVPINGAGFNYFLIAHGTDTNELGYHGTDGRSSFNVTLFPCIDLFGGDVVGDAVIDFIEDITGDNLDQISEESDGPTDGGPIDDTAVEAAEPTTTDTGVNRGPTILESGAWSKMMGRQHQGVVIALVSLIVTILHS